MSIRKVPILRGEYYHIYNRGNGKKEIFLDDEDRERFVKLLYLCNSTKNINFREDIIKKKIDVWDFDQGETIVSIGAWVLMPNHFHLYIISPKGLAFDEYEENKNKISTFMGKLCTSYTMYFNRKHKRTGSLFEGKFKSVNVIDDIQAKYLFSYIHLNPIKLIQSDWKEKGIYDSTKANHYLNTYKWSSYFDYMNIQRNENVILKTEDFPDFFPTKEKFKKEIFEWIELKEE